MLLVKTFQESKDKQILIPHPGPRLAFHPMVHPSLQSAADLMGGSISRFSVISHDSGWGLILMKYIHSWRYFDLDGSLFPYGSLMNPGVC
jgi:hypothetical protein